MGANLNFNSLKPVNTTVNDITETRKEVLVALSTEEINEEDKAVVQEFCQHAKVPGFRQERLLKMLFASALQSKLVRNLIAKSSLRPILTLSKNRGFLFSLLLKLMRPRAILSRARLLKYVLQ